MKGKIGFSEKGGSWVGEIVHGSPMDLICYDIVRG